MVPGRRVRSGGSAACGAAAAAAGGAHTAAGHRHGRHLGRPRQGRVQLVRHLEGQGESGRGGAGHRVRNLLDHDVLLAKVRGCQLSAPPARSEARSDLTVLIGMENPRPALPAVEESELAEYIAELMPMMLPFMSMSAPPELPGFKEASVWIALYVVVDEPVSPLNCRPPNSNGHWSLPPLWP